MSLKCATNAVALLWVVGALGECIRITGHDADGERYFPALP